ncbi:MAG: HNH endonuclease [Alphaproteobacteria bacterium]
MSENSPKKSKGRQKFLELVAPDRTPSANDKERDAWIEGVVKEFVSLSKANRQYYKVMLETLWPSGHKIPGPHIKTEQFRAAVDKFRLSQHDQTTVYKPYVDVFRRVRELQGEEGLTGIARQGNTYQLINLALSPKRIPRVKLSDADWSAVLSKYQFSCAVCGRKEPEVRFDQDHKIPRVRGGGDSSENWQPLCGECNNFKSTACRGCKLDCFKCSWAYPEKFAPIRISSENIEWLRNTALKAGVDVHDYLNKLLDTQNKK